MDKRTNNVEAAVQMNTMKAELIRQRLAYIEKHGCRFLFTNEPPPAPGYPRERSGKVVVID